MSRPVGRASGVSPMPVSEPAAGFRGLRRSIKKCLPRFMGRRRVFSRGGRLPPRSFFLSLIPCLAGKGAVVRLLPVLYFPGSWERHKKREAGKKPVSLVCSSSDVLFGLGLGGFFRLTFRNIFLTCPEAHVIHFLSAYADKRFAGQRRILLESVFFLVGSGIKAVRAQMTDGEHAE